MNNFDWLSVEEILALAALELENEKLEQPLVKLKYLLEQGVENEELYSMLGSVYAKLKLFESAAEQYEQLLSRNENRLHEKFQLGMVHYQMGNNDLAFTHWDSVLESDSTYPPVLFHKAVLMIELDEISGAEKLLNLLLSSVDETNYYAEQANNILEELTVAKQNSAAQLTEIH